MSAFIVPQSTSKLIYILYVLALFLTIEPRLALAEDSSSVIVNHHVIDSLENYTSPPMFDAPLTNPEASKAPETPKDTRDARLNNNDLQKRKPNTAVTILQAPQKPQMEPELKTQQQHRASYKPPYPPKRPQAFFASDDFIQQARAQNKSLEDAAQNRQNKEEVMSEITEDYLVSTMNAMNSADVLENIEAHAPVAVQDTPGSQILTGSASLSLPYAPQQTELTEEQKKTLQALIIRPLLNAPATSTLTLESYANKTEDEPNSDRRTALSRGLAIRDYLLQHDIDGTRIHIKALGDETKKLPTERVDFILD